MWFSFSYLSGHRIPAFEEYRDYFHSSKLRKITNLVPICKTIWNCIILFDCLPIDSSSRLKGKGFLDEKLNVFETGNVFRSTVVCIKNFCNVRLIYYIRNFIFVIDYVKKKVLQDLEFWFVNENFNNVFGY